MANQLFNTVVSKIPRKNLFKMPFESILSAQFGAITPAGIFELFPGDVFMDNLEGSIKLAPMKAPAFSRIDATFHFFFVPRRLLYDEFEDFVTGGTTGTFAQDVSPLNPVAPAFSFQELAQEGKLKDGSLADYLGLPSEPDQGTFVGVPPIDAMPFAGYHKIFSDWYRDELLDTEEFDQLPSGSIAQGTELFNKLTALRYRAWHKDYFSSARPDTQLGPEVGVPISGDVVSTGLFRLAQASPNVTNGNLLRYGTQEEDLGPNFSDIGAGARYASRIVNNNGGNAQFYADGLGLDNALMLINDLRKSVKLQEWREKNMRGGNRYIENMYHHFGVKSSDARLQRSQYLGGKKIPVVVGEVLQTVNTESDQMYSDGAVLGTRGGVANAAGRTQQIRFFAEEHGFVYCLMSILPHAAYMQGIPRMFANRWDPMEYLWPEFGNLGEQEVFNWEIFVQEGSNSGNAGTFGYQSRYADLKTRFNEIHGEFRSSLDFWHNARIFDSAPALNKNFVYFDSDDEAEGQNRIFAVVKNSLASHFYVHLWHNYRCLRMLPKYGIPSL